MITLGIVGTAKNTGKTTTLSAIMAECYKRNINAALTSIGYDGEDLDNITYLPKPKLNVKEYFIVATTDFCLKNSKVEFDLLEKTNIITPLGRIILARIKRGGNLVLAGPNNIRDLNIILDLLKNHSPEIVFVDGALNRMSPMFLMDKIIFSTGAARNVDISLLSKEMEIISLVFNLPALTKYNDKFNTICLENDDIIDTKIFSLLNNDNYEQLISFKPERSDKIFIQNVVSIAVLKKFLLYLKNKNSKASFVFYEPFRILLSLNLIDGLPDKSIFEMEVPFYLQKKPQLACITINPFYPEVVDYYYQASFVNKHELKKEIERVTSIAVFNILEDGVSQIMDLILNK